MASSVAPTTVVMLGDVGMGKSTVVEKVMNVTGLSSDADESFTRSSLVVESPCRRIQVIDTPGGNSMMDKLEHNVWIAHALNYAPVSMILLTVKAETRIDTTISNVRNYAERFYFPDTPGLLTVCVTHMDTVSWGQERFRKLLSDELGFSDAIFVGRDSSGAQILQSIISMCGPPRNFMINSANFLRLFKINNNNLRILKSVQDEISNFRNMKQCFEMYLKTLNEQDKVDLVFEFQAFMTNQIIEAQKRVSAQNSFTFAGDSSSTANEAGHIANLTNQLRAVLFDLRTMALAYQSDAGISELRKCPHCGEVWAKIEGCNGTTTCGNLCEARESRFNTMSSFRFDFDGKKLDITQTGSKGLPSSSGNSKHRRGRGCGKRIKWSDMAPVSVPREFRVTGQNVNTEDVDPVPYQHKRSWDAAYAKAKASIGPMKKIRVR